MKYIIIVVVIVLLALAFFTRQQKTEAPVDTMAEFKQTFTVKPVQHASAAFEFGPVTILNDPVGGVALYESFFPVDLVLLSDIHGDHLDIATLEGVVKKETTIVAPQAVADELPESLVSSTQIIANGETIEVNGITITAIPMYNLPESEDSRHVKGRGNGYLLEYDGVRVYVAGDTADIPEMRNLEDIDVAFIPMNLPYTMGVQTAADAVLDFAPKVVYPYHYRGEDGFADLELFKSIVQEENQNIQVILRNWYRD